MPYCSLVKLAVWWAIPLVALFSLDALLFRTGVYPRWLEPQSYAGHVEQMIERAARVPDGSVLVLGDSRIAEGLSSRLASAESGGLPFFNAAVPASSPRCWFYFLNRLGPGRWSRIVLPLDDYSDEDGNWDVADTDLDTAILAGTLSLADAPGFVASHSSIAARATALRNTLFKGFAFQRDLREFLTAPRVRLEKVSQARAGSAAWLDGYEGLAAELAADQIPAPRAMSPQHGWHHRYRLRWLGSFRDSAGGPERLLAIRLPRLRPRSAANLPSAVRTLGLAAAPTSLFEPLEHREFFADTEHLNRRGRAEFSRLLGGFLKAAAGMQHSR